ncbi:MULTISPECIES: MarR family winged helix-turn-helix transcriptional regulator [Cellulophaga]|uniref:MarR family transcriptional regulator n=1 Tax=Cellulophaga baltica 18 TaxID=1348584 RepID=A0AAU8RDN9_9FLAO|nr:MULTISPECIES: MarR family transcriptional regulator [Cellulophaga]WFO17854.1 MarR family transcriptional regulator [Cellulophaga baltica 4]AIY13366.1 MarR family transcriptional regulator [Cellulophaga baltica NN016038]AIZ41724.1 MarR family transcriptional regulator [Cellulophaga baltica 18]KGK29498.1 MarR family transcriptional regulator [Cellulophaga sp. E6(2014)]MCR1026617.1 MarR family transcriptional regulator [Cellulophaga baltica]
MNVEAIIKTEKEIPLRQRTLIHLNLVSNKVTEITTNKLKPFDVSLQQFNVLRILRGQKGKAANLSTLNDRMVTKMSNTTRLVDKLITKGYVLRTACESNRRKVEIYITESGLDALLQMDKAMQSADETILEKFTNEDLIVLNKLFDKF